MRVIPVKLTSANLRTAISDMRQSLRIPDRGYIEDLFCLVRRKGLGIPDADLLNKVCDMQAKSSGLSRSLMRMMGKVRVANLRKIVDSAFFKQTYTSSNPLEALKMYLHATVSSGLTTQRVRCGVCKLNTKCQFHAKYSKVELKSLKVASPEDVKNLVPEECPDKPSSDAESLIKESADPISTIVGAGSSGGLIQMAQLNIIAGIKEEAGGIYNPFDVTDEDEEAIARYEQLAQKDTGLIDKAVVESPLDDSKQLTVGGGKFLKYYDVDHTGIPPIQFHSTEIEDLSKSAAAFMILAQKLNSIVDGMSSKKFKPTSELTHDSKEKQIEQVSDAVKASLTTHALPDDIFNAKVAKKQVTFKKYEKVDERQKAFYVVPDFSASMTVVMGEVGGIRYTRSAITSAIALAMLSRVMKEGGVFFLRGFAAAPSPTLLYVNAKEPDAQLRYEAARQYIMSCMYDGGGTRVDSAIRAAANDITDARGVNKLLSESEIMLITDADDRQLNKADVIANLRKTLGEIVLNVIDVSPIDSYVPQVQETMSKYKKGLQSIADSYFLAKSKSLNLEEMMESVGKGKTKA